jgi:hypothetical protein
MSQVGTYKGRKYRLKFIGQTKYGRRANLEFFDGSKNFWVDASLVTVSEGTPSGSRGTYDGHGCRNGHAPHPGPCCNGRHGGGYDCGADCCELD